MKRILLAVFYSSFYVFNLVLGQQTAPKIIETIPAFGDCEVDPGVKEIIFKFDQDMQPGMSIPDFKNKPNITGRPTWLDKRTLSVPVQLDSGQFYMLLCNTWKFRNFKNVNSIPLNPDFLMFQTKGNAKPDFNEQTYTEFLNVFPERYSYATRNNVDWTELLKQSKLANCKTNFEFTLKLMSVLKAAEDPHLWIEYRGQKYYPSSRKFYVTNYNIGEILNVLEDKTISEGNNVVSGKLEDIGYIGIGTWDSRKKDEITTAIDRLREMESLKNIIVDVRPNTGGDENLAKEFASCFTDKPIPYGMVKNFNGQSRKFDIERTKILEPCKDGFTFKGNVYVLIGPRALSSNEGFVLMMKQVKNAKVVGMKTYGSSGNPKPYKLSDDITLYLPSWQAYTLEHQLIEGVGVAPDIEIIQTQADFNGKDALFDAVVQMIEKSSM